MDDMYNEELRASSQSRGRSQEKEQKKIEDKSPSDKDLYYPKKPGPPGPPGPPNDPGDGGGGGGGGPPNPPGLPSLRGSQRNSQDDELASQSTLTLNEAPRVSRREADKVTISPWPKHQHLEVWTAETVMAICLAANDGD